MLDLMRKKKETFVIKAIFVLIVLSFIGTIFLVWGRGEEGLGRKSDYAAKVDRTTISFEVTRIPISATKPSSDSF